MTSSSTLNGKTAIVTGSSSGIGRAIAETLGAAGAHVFLASRSDAPLQASKKKIEEAGGKARTAVLDVRDVEQVRALVASAIQETGRLDIMVNNAGLSYPTPILEADPEEWRTMFDTNVIGLLAGCQAAVKAMRECGAEGFIVNISSIAAQRPDSGVYGSTKYAVNCISATLRRELEDDTIRVVNIMPGAIVTNFARNFDPEFLAGFIKATGSDIEVKQGEKLPDDVLEDLQGKLKQMLGNAQDIADAVLYAVSQPIHVNVSEIVVRPPKQINL